MAKLRIHPPKARTRRANHAKSRHSTLGNRRSAISRHVVATVLYVAFAIYLYQPYFRRFETWQWLLPVNACAAAMGGYVLSRRWVAGFVGSLVAGALYGFGPFLLGIAKFHASAGLLAASVPWLFAPAVFLGRKHGKWVGTALLLAPFLVMLLSFYLAAERHWFVAPLQADVEPSDLAGFIAPLVMARRSTAPIGLYHVPVAALVLGLAMMWKARRYGPLVVLGAGFLLAFCKPLLGPAKVEWIGVSPILWLSMSMTWCAVLTGIGVQGLIEAGFADRKWILAAGIVLGALAILSLLLAAKYFQVILGLGDGYARLFVEEAKRHLVGALAMGILFVMTRQKLRLHGLRWAILCTAMGLDIVLGARYIVDKIL